jgi:hypothetical protein
MKRAWLFGCWLLAALAGVRAAEAPLALSSPATTGEITAVIEAQLAAFRAGKVGEAYACAAQTLRRQIPEEAFTTMVRENYPEIWRSSRAEVGVVRDNGTRASASVRVFTDKADATYDYTLVKEAAGWRIDGVLRREATRRNVL